MAAGEGDCTPWRRCEPAPVVESLCEDKIKKNKITKEKYVPRALPQAPFLVSALAWCPFCRHSRGWCPGHCFRWWSSLSSALSDARGQGKGGRAAPRHHRRPLWWWLSAASFHAWLSLGVAAVPRRSRVSCPRRRFCPLRGGPVVSAFVIVLVPHCPLGCCLFRVVGAILAIPCPCHDYPV